jgi:hypothetical protein
MVSSDPLFFNFVLVGKASDRAVDSSNQPAGKGAANN